MFENFQTLCNVHLALDFTYLVRKTWGYPHVDFYHFPFWPFLVIIWTGNPGWMMMMKRAETNFHFFSNSAATKSGKSKSIFFLQNDFLWPLKFNEKNEFEEKSKQKKKLNTWIFIFPNKNVMYIISYWLFLQICKMQHNPNFGESKLALELFLLPTFSSYRTKKRLISFYNFLAPITTIFHASKKVLLYLFT